MNVSRTCLQITSVAVAVYLFLVFSCDDTDESGPDETVDAHSAEDTPTQAIDLSTDSAAEAGDGLPADVAVMVDASPADIWEASDAVTPDVPPAHCRWDPDACPDNQVCRGGVCVGEIASVEAYVRRASRRKSSYWWRIQLPSVFEEEEDAECCFDYTNDGRPDDQLGHILSELPENIGSPESLQALLDGAIEAGDLVILMDWLQYPENDWGDADFALLVGDLERDEDGIPIDDFAIRAAGDGRYSVRASSIDGFGPLARFDGELEHFWLNTGLSSFDWVLTIPPAGKATLSLEAVKIEAGLSAGANGIHTENERRERGEPFLGGGRVGAVLDLVGVLQFLEELTDHCECLTPGESLFVYAFDFAEQATLLACNTASGAVDCADSEPGICGALASLCDTVLPVVAESADVDLYACEEVIPEGDSEQHRCGLEGASFADDDAGALHACECINGVDGVTDSFSVGLYFAATGADITGLAPSSE